MCIRGVMIVAAVAAVSFAGGAAAAGSCPHPLFGNPKYAAGDGPQAVAIGDLDGANGLDLAMANADSDDASVLLNLCAPAPCPCDCEDPPDGTVDYGDFLELLAQWGGPGPCDCEDLPDGTVGVGNFLALLADWGPCP